MNEWKPFLGRITFFRTMSISSPMPSAFDLYRQILGGDPDSFQKQANALIPTTAQGRRGSLMVNCIGQPARIDFTLTASPRQVQAPQIEGTLALIDHPIELRDELMRIINFLGGSFPLNDISRVALSLQFFNLKQSHTEANRALTEVIPKQYGLTITDEEGLVFQINQPRMNREFQDIRLNFITKWSVEQIQVLTIAVPAGGVPVQAGMTWGPVQAKVVTAASVVFDNNSTPLIPVRHLTSKEQSALLQEALDVAVQKQQEIGLNIEWGTST
jgi:hypothetical protein